MFFVFSRPSTMLLLVAMVIYAALGLGFLNTTGLVGEVAWNWMDERSLLHRGVVIRNFVYSFPVQEETCRTA